VTLEPRSAETSSLETALGVDLATALATAGMVETSGKSPAEEVSAAVSAAQDAKTGIFADPEAAEAVRNVAKPTVGSAMDLYTSLKGRELAAQVADIRGGCQLRVLLPAEDHMGITMALAGVAAPGYRKSAETGEYMPEPFAKEAKFFLESAIRDRDSTLQLLGADRQNFIGTLTYGGRDVGLQLIKVGLAKYLPWSGARLSLAAQEQYTAAEKAARAQRLRIWSLPGEVAAAAAAAAAEAASAVAIANASSVTASLAAGSVSGATPKEIEGKVVEVVSSTSLKVADKNTVHLVALSSVRAPNPRGADVAWADAGKEFVRKAVIGSRIRATLDYIKEASTVKDSDKVLPRKAFYTVTTSQKKNLAVTLVKKGYATVIPHGRDGDRSPDYEALLEAESAAKANRAGVHGKASSAPELRLNDLSGKGDKNRKGALKQLHSTVSRRAQVLDAVVEYVLAPARLKVRLPKEGVVVVIAVAGVRVPREPDAEPAVIQAALGYAREHLMQRQIKVRLESFVDASSTLTATVSYEGNKDLARELVSHGWASVMRRSARELYEGGEALIAAEESAKVAKKGIWKNYDAEAEAAREAEIQAARDAERAARNGDNETAETRVKASFTGVVTEVEDGGRLFVQRASEALAGLPAMMKELQAVNRIVLSVLPRTKSLVLAQFSADKAWYRARVEEVDAAAGKANVRYIDYGNTEWVPLARLAELPQSYQGAAPYATLVVLAFIVAGADEYVSDATVALKQSVYGQTVKVDVVAEDGGAAHGLVYLVAGEGAVATSENQLLIEDGLATLQGRWERAAPLAKGLASELSAAQDDARANRRGMWRYGDFENDE
jgi:staphylococcal nuclease domain-containing protein 1